MILMMMTALCCTVQVKADDQSYNLDTIRMEATIEPTETYQYLKPTYQKGVIVTSPWNGNWFVNISGAAGSTRACLCKAGIPTARIVCA